MDILICLVGSNPLPSYVVTKYLIAPDRSDNKMPIPNKVLLIHSSDTKKYAENVIQEIGEDIFSVIDLGQCERDRKVVIEKIIGRLDRLERDEGKIKSIHFNYTAGTKPMAVYGYYAVNKYVKKKNIAVIFSDLNPKDYRLHLDDGSSYPAMGKGDLRACIEISIEKLMKLHGMDKVSVGYEIDLDAKINWDHFIHEITKEIESDEKTIKRRFHFAQKIELEVIQEFALKNVDWKNKIQKCIDKDPPKLNIFETQYWDECFGSFYRGDGFPPKKITTMSGKDFVGFLKFIKGCWLEEFIQYKIQQLIVENENEFSLGEVRRSVEAYYNSRQCEIDVIVMQGYKLYLFSCTTSDKLSEVKLKAFEAMYRASQLGGDHAVAVIVNLMSDEHVEMLKDDLSSFDASQRCKIIGLEDLVDDDALNFKFHEIFRG